MRNSFSRSTLNRGRLKRADLPEKGPKSQHDLVRVAPMTQSDVSHLDTLLSEKAKPMRWTSGRLPLAYSKKDLERLARRGVDAITGAGIRKGDTVAACFDLTEPRARWQLAPAFLSMGITLCEFAVGANIRQYGPIRPTVLVGDIREIARLYSAPHAQLSNVHTVMVIGELDPQAHAAITAVAAPALVVRLWSPPTTFALWAQCRAGIGFHTDVEDEIVEAIDPLTNIARPADSPNPGSLTWTGLSWEASSVLRFDAGVPAVISKLECGACGRASPRVFQKPKIWSFWRALDGDPQIRDWYAELHQIWGDAGLMLCVEPLNVADSELIISNIREQIGPAVVQIVSGEEVKRRQSDAQGEKFVDRRAAAEFL